MQIINPFKDMSRETKGILLMITGLIVLFNTLGIFTKLLQLLIIGGSLYLVLYGLYLSGLYHTLMRMITQKK